MDLAVDEQGLWVLWGNTGNKKRLHASKIDNDVISHTYSLATGKDTFWDFIFQESNVIQVNSVELG